MDLTNAGWQEDMIRHRLCRTTPHSRQRDWNKNVVSSFRADANDTLPLLMNQWVMYDAVR